MKKLTKFNFSVPLTLSLSMRILMMTACAPLVMEGAAATNVAATKEKGVTGSFSDTQIEVSIKLKLYQKDPDLSRRVNVLVKNGEVMLTGALPNHKDHVAAVQIAWEVEGVDAVIDNISASEGADMSTYTADTWITTTLKSSLLLDSGIKSRNYSIKTLSGQVYLMGIAQNQAELDRVIDHARNTKGVSKVISYVKIKGD